MFLREIRRKIEIHTITYREHFWSIGMKTKLSWKAWFCILVGTTVILAFLTALLL